MGASLLTLFLDLGWNRGFGTIVIAHIGFEVSFVALTVRARVRGHDWTLEDASMDLGNPRRTFWKVTLPMIMPGIIAAAMLSFALSLDDFIITFFNARLDHHLPAVRQRRSIVVVSGAYNGDSLTTHMLSVSLRNKGLINVSIAKSTPLVLNVKDGKLTVAAGGSKRTVDKVYSFGGSLHTPVDYRNAARTSRAATALTRWQLGVRWFRQQWRQRLC